VNRHDVEATTRGVACVATMVVYTVSGGAPWMTGTLGVAATVGVAAGGGVAPVAVWRRTTRVAAAAVPDEDARVALAAVALAAVALPAAGLPVARLVAGLTVEGAAGDAKTERVQLAAMTEVDVDVKTVRVRVLTTVSRVGLAAAVEVTGAGGDGTTGVAAVGEAAAALDDEEEAWRAWSGLALALRARAKRQAAVFMVGILGRG